MSLPALPPTTIPTIDELARLLASGVPAGEHAAAITQLTDVILPWDLRSLAGHPNQRRLVELVYQGLADELDAVPDAQRASRLDALACDRTAGRLFEEATSLAVARYVRDHGAPARPELAGFVDPAQRYLAMSAADARRAADASAAAWQAWERDARARFPGCWAAHRQGAFHARAALGSARSGSFASASGPLHAFLVGAGASPQLLDVH